MKYKKILTLFVLIGLANLVAANAIVGVICPILSNILVAVQTIGGTLALIMFIYGGLKYIFSADDPGGRKQGKMTAIHAVIGGIIVILATTIINLIGLNTCP